MGRLVCASIAPHGLSVIGEIAGEEHESFRKTREAMQKMGAMIDEYRPQTIVLLTPHGLRLKGYNAVYTSEFCRGSVKAHGVSLSLDYPCNQIFAHRVLEEAESESIPVVGCNFGALSGNLSNIEMDWGAFIPLWFLKRKDYNPRLVIIGPTREISLTQLQKLGEIIHRIAVEQEGDTALIASADQAHCHLEDGPMGFHGAAKEYDSEIIDIVSKNELDRLLSLDMDWVQDAKPDSLWQMVILHGAIRNADVESKILSYEVPTYFGMMVATYEVLS